MRKKFLIVFFTLLLCITGSVMACPYYGVVPGTSFIGAANIVGENCSVEVFNQNYEIVDYIPKHQKVEVLGIWSESADFYVTSYGLVKVNEVQILDSSNKEPTLNVISGTETYRIVYMNNIAILRDSNCNKIDWIPANAAVIDTGAWVNNDSRRVVWYNGRLGTVPANYRLTSEDPNSINGYALGKRLEGQRVIVSNYTCGLTPLIEFDGSVHYKGEVVSLIGAMRDNETFVVVRDNSGNIFAVDRNCLGYCMTESPIPTIDTLNVERLTANDVIVYSEDMVPLYILTKNKIVFVYGSFGETQFVVIRHDNIVGLVDRMNLKVKL